MVQECATICVGQWPALTVNDAACRMLFRWNVPQFFQTNAINLWLAILVQSELRLNQFGQMAAHTFGKEGIFRMQFHAAHIIIFVAAIARDAHVACRHALNRAVGIIQNFCSRKSGEDFHAQIFRLPRKPAAQIAKRACVGAFVVHETRRQEMRHVKLAGLGHYPMLVVVHGCIRQWAAHIAPIRQQLVKRLWIYDSAG